MTAEATGRGPYIQTYSGGQFFLADPREEDLKLEDFAHALARICRFTGHGQFYSVAQHCVLASRMAEWFYSGTDVLDPQLPARMLIHDASEAYLNDISSPLKSLLPDYKKLERAVEEVVERAVGVKFIGYPVVKEIDLRMLVTERPIIFARPVKLWVQQTMGLKPFTYDSHAVRCGETTWADLWRPWKPEYAEGAYLVRFRELFSSRGWVPKETV